jgi:hypothetical protein
MLPKELFLVWDNISKKKQMKVVQYKLKIIIISVFIAISFSGFSQNKINGISFVASDRVITNKAILPVVAVNANWVALMPFGFMKTVFDVKIEFNSPYQWLGERKEGIETTAVAFKKKHIQIMLKPQIWIPNGGFTGNIKMKNEADWIAFEKNYEKFILFYAQLAQTSHCEMFCIGTELNSFIIARPNFWNTLIAKIKKIYSGKITYAENWDTYKNVPFIKSLDYIGIDAYFPLDKEKTPTQKSIIASWQPIQKQMKELSKIYNKKILFTEFGYQSKDFTTATPWDNSKTSLPNLIGQENALQVILGVFWNKKWFAGGFLWKWHDNHPEVGGKKDTDYTVQNKPSEKLLQKFYTKY